jgi:cation transport ATPase
MDKLSELSHGAKVVLGSAIALLIVSFFNWFEVKHTSYGESMWHGIGFLAGLILIALIVWQSLRLANINIEVGVTSSMITAALAILLLIFTFIRFIAKPGGGFADAFVDRTFWAWLGMALAIVVCVGAWLNMKAAGESLSDVKEKLSSMSAGSRGAGGEAAPAAPAPPAAAPAPPPAAPEAPAAPPADAPDTASSPDEPSSA